jgi:hypothetical protein
MSHGAQRTDILRNRPFPKHLHVRGLVRKSGATLQKRFT